MADDDVQLIRGWSRDKLDLLSKYLGAYARIMQVQKAKWLQSFAYVDAFANAGVYQDAETAELVSGSPIVALGSQPPFDEYWFIEKSAERLDRLRELVTTAAPGSKSRFSQGDANRVLQDEVSTTFRRENYNRAFVFLDPYGLQIEWLTVEALAETRAVDIFVNFPIMAINRLLDRDRAPDMQRRALIETRMGPADWLDLVYRSQLDLFGDEHTGRGPLSAVDVAQRYIANLSKLFGYVSDPVVMRNSQNAPLYALVLASHNPTAVKIMNEIFARYEQLRFLR